MGPSSLLMSGNISSMSEVQSMVGKTRFHADCAIFLPVDVQTLYFPTMVQTQKVLFSLKKLQPLFSLEASTRRAKTSLKKDFIRRENLESSACSTLLFRLLVKF